MDPEPARVEYDEFGFLKRRLCPSCGAEALKFSHTDDVGTEFFKCEKCGAMCSLAQSKEKKALKESLTRAADEKKPVFLSHLNLIEDPNFANRPVVVEALVSSTSISYLCPSDVSAEYTDEDGFEQVAHKRIAADDQVNIQLIGVNELVKYRRLKRFLGLSRDANIRENCFRTVYRIRVRPPVFTLEKRGEKIVDERGYEYKSFDIYVASDGPLVFQPSTLIRVEGIPVPNPKTQQTTLLAYKIEFPEEAHSFNVEKINALKRVFEGLTVKQRLSWILDNFESFSQIVGRRNLAMAGFLAFFTPTWIRLNGEIQKGWANVLFCGDTTTAKTETIRKLIMLLRGGMLVTGETASSVGLTGTATQVEREGWFIDWGFLVLLDRKLLAVDGAHKLSLANWAALAEAERSGVVTIAKAAKNTAYARTRQIKVANPVDREADKYTTKSLGGFLYACQALPTILDKTSIARLDLAVFSDQHDVDASDINRRQNRKHDGALENLAEVLKWCWSDLAEVTFTDDAVDTIHSKATNLYRTFFCEDIPICSIDLKWKLARLSAALAFLTLSTEDYKTVTVTKEHVEIIANFIREEYSKAGLNILAQTEKYEALTLEDVQALIMKIGAQLQNAVDTETVCEVLEYFVLHGRATRDELKTKFSLTENNQLRPLLASLTSEGLIKVSRGFYCEPKLIQAYKASGGFDVAKIAKLANPGKEPPTNSGEPKPKHETPPSFSEVGKVGSLGKNDSDLNKINKDNNPGKEPPHFSEEEESQPKDTPSSPDHVKLVNLVKTDLLSKLRSVFVEGSEEEFLGHAVELGLTQNEARELFERLKGEELFWFDRDGKTFWRWTK